MIAKPALAWERINRRAAGKHLAASTIIGWMIQRQLQVIEYLQEENRILRESEWAISASGSTINSAVD